jgi:hypothetical protein
MRFAHYPAKDLSPLLITSLLYYFFHHHVNELLCQSYSRQRDLEVAYLPDLAGRDRQ